MIVGYIILGSVVGLIASIVSLIAGGSLWFALALYSLVGSSVVIVLPVAQVAIGALALHLRRQNQTSADKIRDASPATDHSPQRAGSEDREAKRMPRILAVDDDPFILGLIPTISAKAGFSEVTSVASAKLALDKLASADIAFDCLLLDINMPEMNGIELCRRVRGLATYRQTPIIMLTGKRDAKSMEQAFQAGATDYATKPFDIVEFGERLRLIREIIEARSGDSIGFDASTTRASDKERSSGIELLDEAQLGGPSNLISRTALANYVTQLPSPAAVSTQIFAVKVDCTDLAHSRTSFLPFMSVLREVAVAASEAIGIDQCMMAYAGDGAILIVSDSQYLPTSIEFETEMNRSLVGILARCSEDDSMVVSVSVGRPVQPFGKKARRAEVAFGRAIGSSNNRALEKHGLARSNHIRLIG